MEKEKVGRKPYKTMDGPRPYFGSSERDSVPWFPRQIQVMSQAAA